MIIQFKPKQPYLEWDFNVRSFGESNSSLNEQTFKYLFCEDDSSLIVGKAEVEEIFEILFKRDIREIADNISSFSYDLNFDKFSDKLTLGFKTNKGPNILGNHDISIHTATYSFEEVKFVESASFFKKLSTKEDSSAILFVCCQPNLTLFHLNVICQAIIKDLDVLTHLFVYTSEDIDGYSIRLITTADV